VKRIGNFLQLPEATSLIGAEEAEPDRGDSSTPSPDKETLDRRKEKKEINLKVPPSKSSDLQASSDSVFGPIHEEEEEEDEDLDEDELDGKLSETISGPYMTAVDQVEIVEEMCTQTKARVLGSMAPPISSMQLLAEVVSIENGDFSWEEDRHDQTLNQITTKIPKGKLTIVVGSIGSGKSSFLSAILGEIKLMRGTVEWGRSVPLWMGIFDH